MLAMQTSGLAPRKDWVCATTDRRTRANNIQADLLKRLNKYEAAEAANKGAQQDYAERLVVEYKGRSHGRIQFHRDAIDSSQQFMMNIDKAVSQLDNVSIKLKKERYERHTQMAVCERRLRLRKDRPQAELVNDCLQQALEDELQLLLVIRTEMLKREQEVRENREALAKLREALSSDTGCRRMKVSHEQHNLKPSVLPTIVGKVEEEQVSGSGALAQATRILGKVSGFCSGSLNAIRKSQFESSQATENIEANFGKHGKELGNLKKNLEDDLATLNLTIEKAEHDLDKHTRRVDPKEVDKVAIIDQSKGVLAQLMRSKQELLDDLHCKMKAWDVFEACKRVSPLNAFEAKKPKAKRPQSQGASSPNLQADMRRPQTSGSDMRRPQTSDSAPNLRADQPLQNPAEPSNWASTRELKLAQSS